MHPPEFERGQIDVLGPQIAERDAIVGGSCFDRRIEVGQLIGRAVIDRPGGSEAGRQQGLMRATAKGRSMAFVAV